MTLNLPIDQIIIEYNSGMSFYDLANKYNCTPSTIRNRLLKTDTTLRSKLEAQRNRLILPIKQIIKEYQNGMSTYDLSNKYNCAPITINNRLKYFGVKIRSIGEVQTLNLPMEQIIKEYNNGMSLIDLGNKYNCSHIGIRDNLIRFDINIRTIKESHNIISTYICIICGHEFKSKLNSLYCPDCNNSGYCYKWNENCRESNRDKYNRECFFCGKSEEENDRKLSVHHIDYNKNQGCDKTPDWKLVPLCGLCHGMVGGGINNRELWKQRIIFLLREYNY